jgi:hypothetical protein
MRLTTAGTSLGLFRPVVGRISRTDDVVGLRSERVRVFNEPASIDNVLGYRALLTTLRERELGELADAGIPIIHSLRDDDHLHDGYVVLVQPSSGFVRTIYRPDSRHNALFLTERCSSNCLMCSQPPKDKDDTDYLFAANLELVQMIAPGPDYLGITGGEPTLLGR